ncbi:disulfide bond formation protein B [Candidatus Cytomitobacter indipagum]|uniref:Disulfide bond formation protein B n=1 Tax=Candidatus Cytomitobacter indipagum TaxID=2601575 RepID=A0A5C0UCZ1_9PROT|nr:disulfide bond formation protein B [Candidatus Cytomitobacter indipagum]QEK37885.1 disulfide bond formation protein B [Candidatus Cytomitobacter indipagum]
MRIKHILNFFLIGILAFSFLLIKYGGIHPCMFCVISRLTFFGALIFSWLSLFRHAYIYISTILLLGNFAFGNVALYFYINGIEPSWCCVEGGSCLEQNTFLELPMQFWVICLSSIGLVLSLLASRNK